MFDWAVEDFIGESGIAQFTFIRHLRGLGWFFWEVITAIAAGPKTGDQVAMPGRLEWIAAKWAASQEFCSM